MQGTSVAKVAKWLHVSLPMKAKPKTPLEIFLNDDEKSEFAEFKLSNDSSAIRKKLFELSFPNTAIVALVKRNNKYLVPNGSTKLKKGDLLVILSEDKQGIKAP